MKSVSTVLVTTFFAVQPADAGPDETTQRLISDPVSMLDLGVFKADVALKERGLGFMEFSWDANRFTIMTFKIEGFADAKAAENLCSKWVADVRALGNIEAASGKPYGHHSTFAENFSHEGFERIGTALEVYSNLDRLIDLNCTAYVNGERVVVTAPLLGTSYALQKQAEK